MKYVGMFINLAMGDPELDGPMAASHSLQMV
jgi:hypothetical protein